MSNEHYKVIYSKDKIQKKKKKFEDGFLIVLCKNKMLELYDQDGKIVAKSRPSCNIIEDGDRGVTYAFVGSLYVELDYKVSEADFLSGKCFTKPMPITAKQITKPNLLTQKINKPIIQKAIQKPLDYFLNEISIENKTSTQCIIDYCLVNKLKEHQKTGIRFMFQSVTGLTNSSAHGCILADSMGLGKTLQVIGLILTLVRQNPFSVNQKDKTLCLFPKTSNHIQSNDELQVSTSTVFIEKSGQKDMNSVSSKNFKEINLLKNDGLVKKVCIVTPLTLVHNWKREFAKWLPENWINPTVVDNNGDAHEISTKVKKFLKDSNKVMICSYETLILVATLIKESIDLLICDEAHRLKNMNSKIYTVLNSFRTKRRILITGTPIQNCIDELFSSLNFVAPLLFENETRFQKVFIEPISKGLMKQANDYDKKIANERAKELIESIKPLMLRRGEEVLHSSLPKKHEFFIFLQLSKLQIKLYTEYLSEVSKKLFNVKTNKLTDVLAILSSFRKIMAHPFIYLNSDSPILKNRFIKQNEEKSESTEDQLIDEPGSHVLVEDSSKFMFVLHILDKVSKINGKKSRNEKYEKTIVVSYSTKILNLMEVFLKKNGHSFFRLDGQTKLREREAIIDKFTDPKDQISIFLLCAKAGGTGLNLITANRMILLDVDWNPSNDKQVMGRVYREGQKNEVLIYRLFTERTIEEEILTRQFEKECLSTILLDKKESVENFRGYDEKESFSEFFFRFLKTEKKAQSKLMGFGVLEEQKIDQLSFSDIDFSLKNIISKVFLKKVVDGQLVFDRQKLMTIQKEEEEMSFDDDDVKGREFIGLQDKIETNLPIKRSTKKKTPQLKLNKIHEIEQADILYSLGLD